ncbi:hypothetical protein [Ferrimonas pelagia]|uniref:hypothetical protein n=1 Tax=Ferrimonas pelagia TaxID=1177826 RepID=UPI0031F09C72
MKRILYLIGCLLFALCGSVFANPPEDSESYSRFSQYQSVKVSPDGKHLAVITPIEGKNALAILETDSLEPTVVLRLAGNNQVGSYHWANNERIIFERQSFSSWFEQPRSLGNGLV